MSTPTEQLDLTNIQGDILSGLPKRVETFTFFQILKPAEFREDLKTFIPLIKTVADVQQDRKNIDEHRENFKHTPRNERPTIPLVGVNISISHFGFQKLEINDANLLDRGFLAGQKADAESLKDRGTSQGNTFVPDWDEEFLNPIDGVFIVAGNDQKLVDPQVDEIEEIFKAGTEQATIRVIATVNGKTRPDKLGLRDHEHFGYLDGVSNPAIIGFDTNPDPGPAPVQPGVILLGRDGDRNKARRDAWMKDGSFLAFRLLYQKVPEFDDFVWQNRIKIPGLVSNDQEGADLFGARLVGRWKSGAPIDLAPFADDPDLGADAKRRNDFQFSGEANFQKLCPFASHVRKTLPRADLEERGFKTDKNRIMRRGISFGEEVTDSERANKKTEKPRGLLFVAYQSSLEDGFQFIQKSWCNDPNFIFGATNAPGLDPLIGQSGSDDRGVMSGVNPDDPKQQLPLKEEWVVSRGGEYFFSPSLSALKDTIAA